MRILQIGLGSMGKRRVRCMKTLGFNDIVAFDPRADRRDEAFKQSGIKTISDFSQVELDQFDLMVISTPPDKHLDFIQRAVEHRIPAFIEASVLLHGLEEVDRIARERDVVLAPSCTLKFHPAIKIMKKIVESRELGNVSSFSYHSGQYLPDWHPWEKVKDFYVSNPETGACREIVPFEMTWMVDVFGWPVSAKGLYGKTMDVGADIDDTYAVTMKMKHGIGTLVVDVVARVAVRSMITNFERGQVLWNWDDSKLRVFNIDSGKFVDRDYSLGSAAAGYNKNIGEQMYIDEMQAFVDAASRKKPFPNSMADDIKMLKILYAIENGSAMPS